MGPFYEGCVEQLTLYVRHQAWLAARPGKGKDRSSRQEAFQADEKSGKTRTELILPPLDAAAHLAEHLFRVGPATHGEAITYQEIGAWMRLTGHELNGWEAETLRRLSSAYLAEYQAAEDATRPPPFTSAVRILSGSEVSARILAMYQQMAAGHAKGGA